MGRPHVAKELLQARDHVRRERAGHLSEFAETQDCRAVDFNDGLDGSLRNKARQCVSSWPPKSKRLACNQRAETNMGLKSREPDSRQLVGNQHSEGVVTLSAPTPFAGGSAHAEGAWQHCEHVKARLGVSSGPPDFKGLACNRRIKARLGVSSWPPDSEKLACNQRVNTKMGVA